MTEMVARLAPGATLEQARTEVAAVNDADAERVQGRVRPGSHYRVAVIPFQEVLGERAQPDAVAAHGRRGVRHDHLGRQRREPDAHARRAPRARARRARGARRRRGAAAAAAARREPRARRSLGAVARPRHRDRRRQAAHLARRAVLAARERDPARRRRCSASRSRCRSRSRCCCRSSRRCRGKAASPPGSPRAAPRERQRSRKQRLQRGLVVAQVAVSVVLLAGAGLLTRTMMQLSEVSTGLRTEEVLTMQVPLARRRRRLCRSRAARGRGQGAVRAHAARDRGAPGRDRCRASAPPCRCAASDVRFEVKAEGKVARGGRSDAARGVSHGRSRVTSARRGFRCSRDASSRPPTARRRRRS